MQSAVYMLKENHLFSHSSAFARSRDLNISSSALAQLSGDCIYTTETGVAIQEVELKSFLVLDGSHDETAIIQVRCQSSMVRSMEAICNYRLTIG